MRYMTTSNRDVVSAAMELPHSPEEESSIVAFMTGQRGTVTLSEELMEAACAAVDVGFRDADHYDTKLRQAYLEAYKFILLDNMGERLGLERVEGVGGGLKVEL